MFAPEPDTVTIHGEEIRIDPDFRIMCDFSAVVGSQDADALGMTAQRFFCEGVPAAADGREIADAMADFYVRGLVPKGAGSSSESRKSAPVFDFAEDECYFRAAFLAEYGIDLTTVKLHWFAFGALFRGLSDECRLKQIIGIRAADLSKIRNREERQRLERLKRLYRIGSVPEESEALARIRERVKANERR